MSGASQGTIGWLASSLVALASHRQVFFSFHYADAHKAAVVRNSQLFKPDPRFEFRDWADWEAVRLRSDAAIERWIDDQLDGTSVTVVLIGENTWRRPWVLHEVERSRAKGNGLLGIYLNRINALRTLGSAERGESPFATAHEPTQELATLGGLLRNPYAVAPSSLVPLSALARSSLGDVFEHVSPSVPHYCWVRDRGHENLGAWIEAAAQRR